MNDKYKFVTDQIRALAAELRTEDVSVGIYADDESAEFLEWLATGIEQGDIRKSDNRISIYLSWDRKPNV